MDPLTSLAALLAAFTIPAAQPTPAPPSTPAVSYGATAEIYYQFNTNQPFDRVTTLRAYDTRSNVFSIQQVAFVIDSAPDVAAGRRFGARVDLQFGQATETVQGNAANEPRPEAFRHVWQAYGSYVMPVGRGLRADVGKFGSNLGYETNFAKDNSQFSRALLFNFLPFYHMGLRLTLPLSDTLSLMYALTNGIQQTEDFNDAKSHQATAVFSPSSSVVWTASIYSGREQLDRLQASGIVAAPDGRFTVVDTYLAITAPHGWSFGADVNHVSGRVKRGDAATTLTGAAVYSRWQAAPRTACAFRYERLDDEGLFMGVKQLLQEVTATVEYRLDGGFLARAEVRRDWSNEKVFVGSQPGTRRSSQTTVTAGLVWWFGSKQGTW